MLELFESEENKEIIILLNKEINKINDKGIFQNKVINKLNSVIKNNYQTEDFKLAIDSLKEIIASQSNEIKELKNNILPNKKELNFFYQKVNDKVLLQNKVINKLNSIVKNNYQSVDSTIAIDSLKKIIISQSNEIKELQNNFKLKEESSKKIIDNLIIKVENFILNNENNKQINKLQNEFIKKEESTKKLIDSFKSKINRLEEKISKEKRLKSKIKMNIPMENHSINKDDGVMVKRESFDDF